MLTTDRLIIRNWKQDDRELFYRINSDPVVMAFFPFRRNRAASDSLFDKISHNIGRDGFGFMAVENRITEECIGFAGLAEAGLEPILPSGSMEIGWRLAPEFWGKGYASEAAVELLRFGFETLGLNEIVSFAVWNNDRSTAVMRRIGMQADPSGDFDHPRVPDTHPHLKRHVFYRLERQHWREALNPS